VRAEKGVLPFVQPCHSMQVALGHPRALQVAVPESVASMVCSGGRTVAVLDIRDAVLPAQTVNSPFCPTGITEPLAALVREFSRRIWLFNGVYTHVSTNGLPSLSFFHCFRVAQNEEEERMSFMRRTKWL
jgi:hypothetical protein